MVLSKGEVVVTADHKTLGDVLRGNGPLRAPVVEVLLETRLAEEGHLLRDVVDELAGGEADQGAQPAREPFFHAQRERVIERVALRLTKRAHARVLRVRTQELRRLDGCPGKTGSRVGDDTEERIRHLVGGIVEQSVAQGEIGSRQLVVLHAALPIRQMLPLAAQICGFYDPVAGQLTLKVRVPLLDHGIAPVDEEALADTEPELSAGSTGRTLDASQRKVEAVRKRIAQTIVGRDTAIERTDEGGAGEEAFAAEAAAGVVAGHRGIEEPAAGAHYRFAEGIPGHSQPRRKVVRIGVLLAGGIAVDGGKLQPAAQVGQSHLLADGIGNGRIEPAQPVVPLVAPGFDLIAQPDVERQGAGDFPIVLHIPGEVAR